MIMYWCAVKKLPVLTPVLWDVAWGKPVCDIMEVEDC